MTKKEQKEEDKESAVLKNWFSDLRAIGSRQFANTAHHNSTDCYEYYLRATSNHVACQNVCDADLIGLS